MRTTAVFLICAGWIGAGPVWAAAQQDSSESGLAPTPSAQQEATPTVPPAELEEALANVESESDDLRAAARATLTAAGEGALGVVLERWDTADADDAADSDGRRRAARALRWIATPGALRAGLERLDDADGRVRLELITLLGRGDLAEHGDARAKALERTALEDVSAEVRSAALEGLARLQGSAGLDALVRLVRTLPAHEAAAAADLLADLPEARDRVRRLVQDALAEKTGRPVAAAALAPLLVGYGRALAETPGGGESAADRAPFIVGAAHPDPRIRLGAQRGWNAYLARSQDLDRHARSVEVLERAIGQGMGGGELWFRRAYLALADLGQPEVALESARALVRTVEPGADGDGQTFLFYGVYFEACAHLAAGDPARARPVFDRAGEILDGLRAERVELRPHLGQRSELHAAVAVDRAVFRTLVEIGRALTLLAEGARPGDDDVFDAARRAHRFALEAHGLGVATDAPVAAGQWDSILDDNLAPRRLIFGGGRAPAYPPREALHLLVDLHRALATVAPLELPGFEPTRLGEERALVASPFDDPERRRLLVELMVAERRRVERRLVDLLGRRRDDWVQQPIGAEMQRLNLRARQLDEQLSTVESGDLTPLRTLRLPSDQILVVAREQLGLGEPAAARALAERALRDLDEAGVWETYYFKSSLDARLEVLIGSSYMDQGQPDEAEKAYQRALARHEGLENVYSRRMREAAEDGPEREAYRAQRERVRLDRSNVLVSLAVNANVRQRDPEKALAYFEQAYELQQNDFMRVLLACYRARSGRFDEARAELRLIAVSPGLYYNLACTYALMGESDPALDYLAREFAENHPDPASATRQREWARDDPDLASLRGDPRFERMVAPE